MPSHYLKQCWIIVNWTLRNKRQWNFNQNSNIFSKENAVEYVVCEMAAILSRPQCVNWLQCNDAILHHRFSSSLVQTSDTQKNIPVWNLGEMVRNLGTRINLQQILFFSMGNIFPGLKDVILENNIILCCSGHFYRWNDFSFMICLLKFFMKHQSVCMLRAVSAWVWMSILGLLSMY